jgi:hypothetical protein
MRDSLTRPGQRLESKVLSQSRPLCLVGREAQRASTRGLPPVPGSEPPRTGHPITSRRSRGFSPRTLRILRVWANNRVRGSTLKVVSRHNGISGRGWSPVQYCRSSSPGGCTRLLPERCEVRVLGTACRVSVVSLSRSLVMAQTRVLNPAPGLQV